MRAVMPDPSLEISFLMVCVITVGAVIICVLVHNYGLALAWRIYRALPSRLNVRLGIVVYFILLLHLLEIIIFAVGLQLMSADKVGLITVEQSPINFGTLVYFSGAVYTTLGFGDIVPTSTIRLFTIVESLTGLMLVSWSATFTFMAMQEEFKSQNIQPGSDL